MQLTMENGISTKLHASHWSRDKSIATFSEWFLSIGSTEKLKRICEGKICFIWFFKE